MKVSVTESGLAEVSVDAAIVWVSENTPLLATRRDAPSTTFKKKLTLLCKQRGFSGVLYDTLLIPTWSKSGPAHYLLVGVGPLSELDPSRLIKTVQAATRQAHLRLCHRVALSLPPTAKALGLTLEAAARLIAQASDWATYQVKAKRSPKGNPLSKSLTFTDTAKSNLSGVRRSASAGAQAGKQLRKVADLANLPGNQATPQKIASTAKAMAKELGLTCTVWGTKELKREKCEAILAVAQGSPHGGRLITLSYPGTRKKEKPLVLVGKTITFDTGGISLKPPKSMEWMKYDKCGGMAVLAAMAIIAQQKPSRPVIGLLAVAENMPGSNAIKPGDIIGSRAGKTIEILNTDAEGRLVLADALAVAGKYKPAAIIDVATLTGAVISALGSHLTGLMGNDEDLLGGLEKAGQRTGDRVWRLPLLPEFTAELGSPFADLKNIGTGGGGSSVASAFLQEFVPAGVPWAHLDIAGTAWLESNKPFGSPGATLSAASLLVDWVQHYK